MSQFLTITISFFAGVLCAFVATGIYLAWEIRNALKDENTDME